MGYQRIVDGNDATHAVARLRRLLQPRPPTIVQGLDVPLDLRQPPVQARLVRRDGKLAIDAADGFPFSNHDSRQIFGKMTAGDFGVKYVAEDGQRFLHNRWKVHNGWHSSSLRWALRVLRMQRGVLHYTPSSLLCNTSVINHLLAKRRQI